MTPQRAYAIIYVSEQVLATGGPMFRKLLRDEVRYSLSALGTVERIDAYRIDPFERHDDLDAPIRTDPSVHVIKAWAWAWVSPR